MRANLSANAKGKYKFYGQLKLLLTPESSEHSARSTCRLLLGQDCSVESKGKIEVKAVFRIRKFCLDPDTDPELLFRFRIQHKKKEKLDNLILIFSVAKPEPPGASVAEPPLFWAALDN